MASDDYILDIGGLDGSTGRKNPVQSDSQGRPFISVHFVCCNVYQRVYRNASGSAYVGWCPRCARRVEAKVGPDGVSTRFFQAS